ncbi:hypothetical protein [Methylohalobius crimeensis]|uniref:hypothetical protein n=1 Tax=Methylohalobius crimeensis TaxID=244365 RepID=UPI0003B44AB2|nr:hypothetical protein [Methylohalobius crimeensis]
MPNPTTRATARTTITTQLTFTYYRGYDSTGAAYPGGPLAIISGLTFEQAKREFEAHDRQGFIECDQTGAGYYGDEYPWLTRDGREVPSPLKSATTARDHTTPTTCVTCNGIGVVRGSRDLDDAQIGELLSELHHFANDARGMAAELDLYPQARHGSVKTVVELLRLAAMAMKEAQAAMRAGGEA